jgi:DNA polymerase III epsilon subunit-like protein
MIFVDVETTGLDSSKHGILSIGAVNFENPNNYFMEKVNHRKMYI